MEMTYQVYRKQRGKGVNFWPDSTTYSARGFERAAELSLEARPLLNNEEETFLIVNVDEEANGAAVFRVEPATPRIKRL
jgi:hypothetical protein